MISERRVPGALMVWVISYLFFLSTLVTNFSASHDSIEYLNDIAAGRHLFHEHHLLYHFLAYKWLSVLRIFLPAIADHFLIEAFTAAWGSSALVMVWLFLRNRFYLLSSTAAAGTAVIAFSYGFWFYSVNIEVYLPPLFFVLACLYVITGKNFSVNDAWKIAVLHSLAILFHQSNILFAPVVFYVFIVNKYSASAWLQYIITGTVISVGCYFIAGWIIEEHHSLGEWLHWMQGYTVGHGYWQPLTLKTPLHVLTGFMHAFIGGHFIFQLPLMEEYLHRSFQSHGLNDEVFLSQRMSHVTAIILSGLFIIYVMLFLLMVYRFARYFKTIKAQFGPVVSPMLVCIACYSVFFCFWMPEILEFWILQMVLVWLLLLGTLPLVKFPFKIPVRNGVIFLALILFSINFFGSIRWLQDINNDWYFDEVKKLNHPTRSDLIIVRNEWILKNFIRHYTNAKVIADDEEGFDLLQAKNAVRETISKGGKVYLYKPPVGSVGSSGHWDLIQSY